MASVRIDRRPGQANVLCGSDSGPGSRQHNGGPASNRIGRMRTPGFRGRRRLGWFDPRRDRFGRNRRSVRYRGVLYWSPLCRIANIPDIEFISLAEHILHEAGADRGWTCDSFLGNRCGHPRRERSAETCKAKRRDPKCSDQNRTPVSNVVSREETPSSRPLCNGIYQP
jgi:hypothetical protein